MYATPVAAAASNELTFLTLAAVVLMIAERFAFLIGTDDGTELFGL